MAFYPGPSAPGAPHGGHHGGPHGGPHARPHGPTMGPTMGPPGAFGGPGNPVADCICCPCNFLCYILYACQEISYCCCGMFSCFGYERRDHHGRRPW